MTILKNVFTQDIYRSYIKTISLMQDQPFSQMVSHKVISFGCHFF